MDKARMMVNTRGQMIELGCARMVLWMLGFAQFHRGDHLVVFNRTKGERFYKTTKGKVIAQLYIDEGDFSDVVVADEFFAYGMQPQAYAWQQLVPLSDLLRVIASKYLPDFEPAPCSYGGHGRIRRHEQDEYATALEACDTVIAVHGTYKGQPVLFTSDSEPVC